jgi:hypothetical protein
MDVFSTWDHLSNHMQTHVNVPGHCASRSVYNMAAHSIVVARWCMGVLLRCCRLLLLLSHPLRPESDRVSPAQALCRGWMGGDAAAASLSLPPQLTAEQRTQFFEQGHLRLPALFSPGECRAWRQRILSACATPPEEWSSTAAANSHGYIGATGGTGKGAPTGSRGRLAAGIRYEPERSHIDPENPHGLLFVQGTNLLGDEWLSLVLDSRVVSIMCSLLGREGEGDVNFHSMKATLKPPGHVSQQGYHQDSYYIHDERPPVDRDPSYCPFATVLIYLDETREGAGATKVAAGSHRDANGLHGGFYSEANRAGSYNGSIAAEAVEGQYEILQPEMGVGDAMVIHAHVTHSVGDNATDRTRFALAQVYKDAHAVDVAPGEGNTRSWAELPAARGGELAFALGPRLAAAAKL